MQIFRGAEAATVELVGEAPDTVAEADLVELVHRGGAQELTGPSSKHLIDLATTVAATPPAEPEPPKPALPRLPLHCSSA